jgi:hypothetical protein
MTDYNSQQGQVAQFRIPGAGNNRNSATTQMRAKLATDLKAYQQQRERLLGELYDKKSQIDDVDTAIDTTVNAINRLDREKLMMPGGLDEQQG